MGIIDIGDGPESTLGGGREGDEHYCYNLSCKLRARRARKMLLNFSSSSLSSFVFRLLDGDLENEAVCSEWWVVGGVRFAIRLISRGIKIKASKVTSASCHASSDPRCARHIRLRGKVEKKLSASVVSALTTPTTERTNDGDFMTLIGLLLVSLSRLKP